MNSFYHCKSIINKEIFLFFGVCLSFLYCFICAMSKALHFLSIILYYRIVNEATTYIFIFWCDKFSILFQQVFNKVCNLSNFFIYMHTIERCLSSRNFNKFLIYRIVHLNITRLLLKCQICYKGSSSRITNSSIIIST